MLHEAITPKTAAELGAVLTPLAANLNSVATVIDIDAATVTKIENFKKIYDYLENVALTLTTVKEQAIATKAIVFFGDLNVPVQPITVTTIAAPPAVMESGMTKSIMSLIKTIKTHKNYTEEIGRLLGIIGAIKIIDFTNVKASMKVKKINPEGIEFYFPKHGAEEVKIWRFIYEDTTTIPANFNDVPWGNPVAVLAHSPYVDGTPNKKHKPETRVYKIRLVYKDKLVGIKSDVLVVIAAVYIDQDGSEISTKVQ